MAGRLIHVKIALVPSSDAEEFAFATAEKVGHRWPAARLLVSDSRNFHPHITLHAFRTNCAPREMLRKFRNLELQTGDLACSPTGVWHREQRLGVEIECTNDLRSFHLYVAGLMKDLVYQGTTSCRYTLTAEEERNRREYGYPFVGNQYRPHVAIAELNSPNDFSAARSFMEDQWLECPVFHPDVLGIFKVGVNEVCAEVIQFVPLGQGAS